MEKKEVEKIKELIINITIPEFGQPETPADAIEKVGYERARGMYAEAKIRALKEVK